MSIHRQMILLPTSRLPFGCERSPCLLPAVFSLCTSGSQATSGRQTGDLPFQECFFEIPNARRIAGHVQSFFHAEIVLMVGNPREGARSLQDIRPLVGGVEKELIGRRKAGGKEIGRASCR